MQPLTAYAPFRSGHGRATSVVLLLAAGIAVYAVSALSTAVKILSGAAAQLPSEELTVFDLVDLGVGLINVVVFLATVVLFCMWLYRAYQNLPALGNPKQGLNFSPGWAVGSFFVPIVNLFVPYRAVRETWAKSDPAVPHDNYVAPQEPPAPGIMKAWWALWLISNFVDNASARFYWRADSGEEMLVASWLDMFGDSLSIPAAAFAILVVREIDRRQEERSRRVHYVPSAPPPPPIFAPPPPPHFRQS